MNNLPDFFVGSKNIIVKDNSLGISFNVLLHYPTKQVPSPTQFGPYTMLVSSDAAVAEGRFPLLIISHGNGGSHLLYRSISMHLAANGFVVAMVEHYGNNRNDNSLENTVENLIYRPRHVSLTIDKLLNDQHWHTRIVTNKIAIIGHSLGGYTALALGGGIPRTKQGEIIETYADSRIKVLVLLAPGAGWFMHSLSRVTQPILLMAAEHDSITPLWNSEIILEGVPDKRQVIFRMIENAGHFSFLSPFPESMKKSTFLPSTDPAGFDRERFHQHLPSDIREFLNNSFTKSSQ